MPVISNFPGGGSGGIELNAVSNITTLTSSGKVYIKWKDPMDTTIDNKTATWAGTLLVRKAGAMPTNRRDGTIVLDSKTRNAYQNQYFCDSGLSNGVTYYYKFFPYTTKGVYGNNGLNEFNAIPNPASVDGATDLSVAAQLNGRVQLTWTDPAASKVIDGAVISEWASTKVVYKTGGYPTSPEDGTLALNSTTRNAYITNPLEVTGLTNGTTYYFALFTVSTDGVANVTDVTKVTAIPNRIKISKVPTQGNYLMYENNLLSPEWNDYDPSQLTIGGTLSAINAGNYNAEFTPKDEYCWSDGTTNTKIVIWSVEKSIAGSHLNTSEIILNNDNLTSTFICTTNSDGIISAQSSDITIATVAVNGNEITVSSANQTSGRTTITVSISETANYLAATDQTLPVIADFTPTVPSKAPLNDMSWENIRKVSDAGLAASYWSVGDTKNIILSGRVTTNFIVANESVWAFIIGFDHNASREGNDRIHFQIGKTAQTGGDQICFVDGNVGGYVTAENSFQMNPGTSSSSCYNTGGWQESYMRKNVLSSDKNPTGVLSNSFMNIIPSTLRNVMKSCIKYTDNTGGTENTVENVTATTDYLWLLSEFEVFGENTYANQYEQNFQQQYQYYASGNSKIFKRHNTKQNETWWLRTARAGTENIFGTVQSDGSVNGGLSGRSLGVAPAFCV